MRHCLNYLAEAKRAHFAHFAHFAHLFQAAILAVQVSGISVVTGNKKLADSFDSFVEFTL